MIRRHREPEIRHRRLSFFEQALLEGRIDPGLRHHACAVLGHPVFLRGAHVRVSEALGAGMARLEYAFKRGDPPHR
jgi:hypothetical protein